MNLSRLFAGAITAGAIALTAAPANAYIFGFSDNPNLSNVFLTLDGTTDVFAYDTGWYEGGSHDTDNLNYIVTNPGELGFDSPGHNNWFAFDLSNLRGTFTSATLTIFGYTTTVPATYVTYDFGGNIGALTGGTGGLSAFNDLASGVSYGSFAYTSADNNVFRTLTLNSAAVADINAAVGGQFAFGGTIGAGGSVVPEPGTWAMMLIGFAGLGAALRARRRQVISAFAA
jgi:hypothetical protein